MFQNNDFEKLVTLVSLSRITFLSLSEKINLLKNLDSSKELALMSLIDFEKLFGRNIKAKEWNGKSNLMHAEEEARIIEAKKIGFLYYEEPSYPALLRESVNAPFVLFYRGNPSPLLEKSVSVVGTRKATYDGRKAAFQFAYDAVMDECNVVSGLAQGIDGEAHKGAVEAAFDLYERTGFFPKAKTIAVLPCGIDTVYPSNHKRLAENIIRTGGCLVSEYVPGTPSQSFRFVQRNRIIASLSRSTVVIEAPNGSGALITCDFALDSNREVMFHKACFSENANVMREKVKQRQALELSRNEISLTKAERTVESFLNQGAPVISDYKDYLACLEEVPGLRNANYQQELF